jgi:hypothetical protein
MACRHRWRLQYDYRIKGKGVRRSLELGDAIHRYIACFLLGKDPAEGVKAWIDQFTVDGTLSLEEELALEDIADEAEAIGARTINFIGSLGWQTVMFGSIPMVEAELSKPIPGWDRYVAHLDWLALDPLTNAVWLVDFKTRGTFLPEFSEETNLQHSSYQKMLMDLGLACNGTATIQILSKMPAEPKINQNGSVSRTSVKTDWPTYKAAILRAGGDPNHYLDMKSKLDDSKFFGVMYSYRSQREVENVWERIIVPTAADIKSALDGESVRTYRSFSHRVCNGCDVRDVCIGGLRDYDGRGLLQMYEYNEEREAEIARGLA